VRRSIAAWHEAVQSPR